MASHATAPAGASSPAAGPAVAETPRDGRGRDQYRGAGRTPLAPGSSLVMYDQLGAGVGHVVGFTEGAEATAPFPEPTPVDAYCAAIIDQIFYQPPA
jgi:ethanolamine utilization protein EutN